MSDINDLDLNKSTGIKQEGYQKPSRFSRPAFDPGDASLIRDAKPDNAKFSPTKKGDLMARVRFQSLENEKRGFYDRLFTTPGQYRVSTSADDFVRACGGEVQSSNGAEPTNGDYKAAIEQHYGPFDAFLDWEAYCESCGKTTVKGSKNFMRHPDGSLNHEVKCPTCGDDIGAQVVVKRFVVK